MAAVNPAARAPPQVVGGASKVITFHVFQEIAVDQPAGGTKLIGGPFRLKLGVFDFTVAAPLNAGNVASASLANEAKLLQVLQLLQISGLNLYEKVLGGDSPLKPTNIATFAYDSALKTIGGVAISNQNSAWWNQPGSPSEYALVISTTGAPTVRADASHNKVISFHVFEEFATIGAANNSSISGPFRVKRGVVEFTVAAPLATSSADSASLSNTIKVTQILRLLHRSGIRLNASSGLGAATLDRDNLRLFAITTAADGRAASFDAEVSNAANPSWWNQPASPKDYALVISPTAAAVAGGAADGAAAAGIAGAGSPAPAVGEKRLPEGGNNPASGAKKQNVGAKKN